MKPTLDERVLGCFLGGAVGDALGAPVEFLSLEEIKQKYGEYGITDYDEVYGRTGAITDDTQMTLFTAEGLIRANNRYKSKGICAPHSVISYAYIRWLMTQGETIPNYVNLPEEYLNTGWLITNKELHHQRAPGNTVMHELMKNEKGKFGFATNNSKGCGGVMRVAPIGLCASDTYDLASKAAHYTHGHPTGYISAGAFSLIISEIIKGSSIEEATTNTIKYLEHEPDSNETITALNKALELSHDSSLTPKYIEDLGAGWIAEEALSIAVFCSLKACNYEEGVLSAVNHSGDSDSTGSIAGNILGAFYGISAIPKKWLDGVEAKEIIEQVSYDFISAFIGKNEKGLDDNSRYPGY